MYMFVSIGVMGSSVVEACCVVLDVVDPEPDELVVLTVVVEESAVLDAVEMEVVDVVFDEAVDEEVAESVVDISPGVVTSVEPSSVGSVLSGLVESEGSVDQDGSVGSVGFVGSVQSDV